MKSTVGALGLAGLAIALGGCKALSPDTDVLRGARNLSPATTVSAGEDLTTQVEAAVAKATAGRDQQVEAALKLLSREQQIRAEAGAHVSAPSMVQGLDGWDVAILAAAVALAATLGHVLMMLANRLTRRWFPDPREARPPP